MEVKEEPIVEKEFHALDLPALYKRPSATLILQTLSRLAREPPSWDRPSFGLDAERRCDTEGVARYLTSVIASGLSWVEDEKQRIDIWEVASQRLSAISGRTAMPAMTRVFTIPASTHDLKVSLHEPSLTADNLGLKTWAASYLLSKRLRRLSSLAFPTELQQSPRVLELGAGTGLVGITAAAVWGAHVHLTDLEEIQHNLSRNIEANNSIIAENSGSATSGTLNWATDTGPSSEAARYPIILAADSLYSPEHPHLLATTIERWLQMSRDSRAIVELPLRQGYAKETEEFKTSMRNAGFSIIYQGEEAGADDWKTEVNCWWGVFSYMVN